MAKDLKQWCNLEYLAALPAWTKIRDCFDGEDAIKSKHEAYLPRLKAQTLEDYNNYLYRALFFPITGKTCTSMIGLAVAEPPKITYPDLLASYFQDTEQGYQFTEFYVKIFTEVVLMGRLGVLLDAPIVGSTQPTLCRYVAENIMKWDQDEDGKLVRLMLREFRQVAGQERFETMTVCIIRHCYLDETGQYWVEELDDDLKNLPNSPPVQPTFMGTTLDYIPFTCFGCTGIHIEVDKPPMQDISTLNLSHYLTSADLEWGRHIVGLPTPVVSGVDSSTNLHIGGTAAWILPVVEAKAYYLEFQGLGLKSLETAMTDKVSLMASVSARLIDNSTRGSEAADTVKLRYMSESASLIQIVGAIENGCMVMYNMLAKLMKTEAVSIKFSKEILGTGVSMTDMATLFAAYLTASISKDTLVYNLRRLGAIDPNRTDEEELAAIRNPPPVAIPAAPQPAPSPKP